MPDLSGINRLASRLGAVSRETPEGDAEGDMLSVEGQQVTGECLPVSPVSPFFASQPKADFQANQPENGGNFNKLSSPDRAKNPHFEKLEDWKIRYLERAGVREFDANLTRDYAERAAWQDIVAEWAELHGTHREDAEAALIARGMARPPD